MATELYQGIFAVFNAIYPLSDEIKNAIIKNTDVINAKKKHFF